MKYYNVHQWMQRPICTRAGLREHRTILKHPPFYWDAYRIYCCFAIRITSSLSCSIQPLDGARGHAPLPHAADERLWTEQHCESLALHLYPLHEIRKRSDAPTTYLRQENGFHLAVYTLYILYTSLYRWDYTSSKTPAYKGSAWPLLLDDLTRELPYR